MVDQLHPPGFQVLLPQIAPCRDVSMDPRIICLGDRRQRTDIRHAFLLENTLTDGLDDL
jgi:hypothetical protein